MIKDQNGTPVLVDDETGEVLATAYFKTPYNHNRNQESTRTGFRSTDESRTDQSFRDEVDINTIIDRIRKTGESPIPLPEHFGSAFDIPTLYDARMRIAENNATFYNLAPDVRAKYLNDPSRWEQAALRALADANLDELKEMGLDISDLTITGIKNAAPAPSPTAQGGTPAPGPSSGSPAPAGDPQGPSGASDTQ